MQLALLFIRSLPHYGQLIVHPVHLPTRDISTVEWCMDRFYMPVGLLKASRQASSHSKTEEGLVRPLHAMVRTSCTDHRPSGTLLSVCYHVAL